MLARQFRILLRIRLGQQMGTTRSQLISQLKLNSYYADRYFKQAERVSMSRLSSAFEHLAALEHGLKSGGVETEVGLDLLLAELCA